MPRAYELQKRKDEQAFPVRVRVVIPEYGLSRDLLNITHWLHANIGRSEYAEHSAGRQVTGHDTVAYYFRTVEAAQAFLDAHPSLMLADAVDHPTYGAPTRSAYFYEREGFDACNLYSQTSGQQAIIEITRAMTDSTGNLPALPGIYPDMMAPVVRNHEGSRELAMLRWGMPSPPFVLKGKQTDRGVTNVRNTQSPHWRRWLSVECRCVVPFTSFAEPDRRPDSKSQDRWFALDETGPLAFFAGIWTTWTSTRKLKDGPTTDELFAFLTTDPNEVVAPIHQKAMPAILTTAAEVDHWLTAPIAEALALQRPLPAAQLEQVGESV